MAPKTIFITYNPGNNAEETIAARLHTIGAVSGFRMYMPDRFNSSSILDLETKRRINQSDYLIMFSMSTLSNIVKQELEEAFKHIQDKSRIIVIYDKQRGKNLNSPVTNYFTSFFFDKYNNRQEDLLHAIINSILHRESMEKTTTGSPHGLTSKDTENTALAALLGVGLGLFILGILSGSKS